MKRNANGNGSVRKISVARTVKHILTGRPATQPDLIRYRKQKQHSITGKTQKEVLQKLKAATAAIDNGSYIEPSAMTVAQWLQSWSDNYLRALSPPAYLYRRSIALYLTPNPVQSSCALKTQQIQAFYNDLPRPQKNAEPLSPKTIKNIWILHKALQQVAMGIFGRIPPMHAVFEGLRVTALMMMRCVAFFGNRRPSARTAL
ncbi:MAG: hypothetical protein ACLVDB_07310 [Anaeromassilibacillus sp.]